MEIKHGIEKAVQIISEELKKNSTTSIKQEKSQGLALNVLRDDMGSVKRAALTQGSIFTHDTGTHKRLDSLIPELRSIARLKGKLDAGPGGAPGGRNRSDVGSKGRLPRLISGSLQSCPPRPLHSPARW